MAATPETGFLIIADLSGYTAYLSGSEIEHAPIIAGDLLETIVGRLDPPFRISKFEGDAAFLFVEDGRADAALLLDAIEASYLAFRRRLRSIDAATSCDCRSCQLAPRLDLKIFIHHGSYVHSRIAGRDELAGRDVILVHRLLKSDVAARTGDMGFALFTGAALDGLGLDPARLELVAGEESFEHLGAVPVFVWDLERRWQEDSGRRRLDGTEGVVLLEASVTSRSGLADVWAHLTTPALRGRWEGPLIIEEAPTGGKRGVGTITQCITGRLATIEEIVDWQPYDHIGWRLAVPGIGPVEATADLDGAVDGTRLTLRWTVGREIAVDAAALAAAVDAKRTALSRLMRVLDDRVGDTAGAQGLAAQAASG